MRKGKLYLYVVLLMALTQSLGCANNDQIEKDLASLRSQMIEMQKSNADMNLRMEELSNSIFILQERSKANTDAIKDVSQPRIVIQDIPAENHLTAMPSDPLPQGPVQSPSFGTAAIKSSVGVGIPVQASGLSGSNTFDSARQSYSQDNFGLAVFDFSAFLQKNPTGPQAQQARYFLGMSYFKLNEYGQAAREFTRYLSDYPAGARAAEVTYMAGLAYNAAGQPDQARTFFDLAAKKYPGTVWATKAARATKP